jgi:crossover junction endodeoxyribonuclease RusA
MTADYRTLPARVEPEMFSTTFTFPWTKAPLSLNYRMNTFQEAKIIKELRSLMHAEARIIPDLGKCRVELVWWVNTHTRRDEENIVPVLKALCDGLVDAEVVVDDTREYMTKMMPAVLYVSKKERLACFQFTVTQVAQ